MNFNKMLLLLAVAVAALSGNAEAGKGSAALNKLGGIVVRLN